MRCHRGGLRTLTVSRWDGSRWQIAKRLAEPDTGPPGDVPTGVLAISPRNVWVLRSPAPGGPWVVGWPSSGTGAGVLLKLSGGHWSRYSMPLAIQPGPGPFIGAASSC
jgi:hypothetical protein